MPRAEGTYATNALRNYATGTDLDREALKRWENYRSMFFNDGYIAVFRNQGNIYEFIKASNDGFAQGSTFMYMHRICGSSVEVNPSSPVPSSR
ncbi:hypothetical protein BDW62DRAFT_205998 [Aspergillus aurantiobrunneus]